MAHATTKIGDYVIPLIGIPESATDEKCDTCGAKLHISNAYLCSDGKIRCSAHKKEGDKDPLRTMAAVLHRVRKNMKRATLKEARAQAKRVANRKRSG